MSEETKYEWPDADQVHEWFGKHPSDAKTKELTSLRANAFSDPTTIPEGVYRAMASKYDEALNNGICPCGSKATYSGCCRQDWLVISRGRKRAMAEAQSTKKDEPKDEPNEDEVEWLVMVGFNDKGGLMLAAPPGAKEFNLPHAHDAMRELVAELDHRKMVAEITDRVINALSRAKSGEVTPDSKKLVSIH